MEPGINIAIVGGDERRGRDFPIGVRVRRFASNHFGGNGGLKRVLTAIASGTLDLVVLLVRWLGHPAADRVRSACKQAGVPCHNVSGGESSATRLILSLAFGGR